jgi:hypothetical protein
VNGTFIAKSGENHSRSLGHDMHFVQRLTRGMRSSGFVLVT